MIWLRVILDGIAMGAVFALTLCVVSSVDPKAFTKMYPLGIQKIAPPMPEKSRKTKGKMLWILWTFTILFDVISNYLTGISGFGNLFHAGYIQMFLVDMSDLVGWNIIFREKMGKRLELILICPLNGLINAGILSL